MLACDMGSMGFGMWGAGGLLLAVLFGVAVWFGARLAQRPSTDARATLERRFATGEIDEEEFERRRHVLEEAR
jgi:putative membrane protein